MSYYSNIELKGEPFRVATEQDINREYGYGAPLEGMPADNFSIRFEGELRPVKTGKYYLGIIGDDGFRLYLEDKLVIDSWLNRGEQTRVYETELKGGHSYLFRLEYFEGSNNAQIVFSWHEPDYDLFDEALKIASEADAIIFAGGITPRLEGEEMGENISFEGFYRGDRTKISLPAAQTEMLRALVKLGKPLVFVNMSGSAVSFVWENENVPAIIQAWYPGEAGGEAIADIIFGNANPSGRLPVTFYKSEEQLPPYEDYAMAGRTYRYFEGEALYPFGHGLSYSTFEYSNLSIKPGKIKKGKGIRLSVEVKNISDRDGNEVVQVYITDNNASFPAPVKSLKAFKKIHLKAGEKKKVLFDLKPDDFALYNDNAEQVVEPGDFTIMAGSSSASGIEVTAFAKKKIVIDN